MTARDLIRRLMEGNVDAVVCVYDVNTCITRVIEDIEFDHECILLAFNNVPTMVKAIIEAENQQSESRKKMRRIDYIRSMPVGEMAEKIIKLDLTDEFCLGDCTDEGCPHEQRCCMK